MNLILTQEELSEKSGIDYKHIQNFESYRRRNDPKYSTLWKLAEALNIDILELIIQMNKQQYPEEDVSKINFLVSESRKKKNFNSY